MIQIKSSKQIDTRSCDFIKVSKELLRQNSIQHIADVRNGIEFLKLMLDIAAKCHDFDKLTDLDGFHSDFLGGFVSTKWWDKHILVNRHHFLEPNSSPEKVNLIDVLEMITDCIMAGMARTGNVYPIKIPPDVLMKAFDNTVEIIKSNIEIINEE